MRLLETFRRICGGGAAGYAGDDRRTSPRYESVPTTGTVAWRDGRGDMQLSVTLRNIGTQGALLEASTTPPMGQALWVRLELPRPTEWYEAVVVRVEPPDAFAVRFPGACPYDLYKAATGIRSVERSRSPAGTAGFDARDWR